jgi:hypothetical protein
MGELIPNLDDLRAKLRADESTSDAEEFMGELATAGTVAEINAKIDALVDRWLELPDDSE